MIYGANDLQLDDKPPKGLLRDVQYDPKTGRLSFMAKVSLTWYSDNTGSHDMYLFDGTLTLAKMKGVMTVKEAECTDCGEEIDVVLPRKREPIVEQEAYKNMEEWNADNGIILDFRGLNW